jgi:hypothetical protein
MGNQRGQECREEVGHAWGALAGMTEDLRKVTPPIDLGSQVFDTPPWQGTFECPAELDEPRGHLQGFALFELDAVPAERDRRIGGQALRGLRRYRVKCALEPRPKVVGSLGELEFGIGLRAFSLPTRGLIDQVGKGDVAATGGEEDIPRTQPIAYRDGQAQFPRAPIEGAVRFR